MELNIACLTGNLYPNPTHVTSDGKLLGRDCDKLYCCSFRILADGAVEGQEKRYHQEAIVCRMTVHLY